MMTIVLATHNPHKRDELRAVLAAELGESVTVLTLDDVSPPIGEIEETGTTLEENALIKARAVFRATGKPSLSDDTGLEVTALGGAPGVYSARYAGEHATYEDNVAKLLSALSDSTDRSAHFATAIAFIDTSGAEHLFRGEVKGTILTERRGSQGFGYDPIFAPAEDPAGRTFAEMAASEKNLISHRGRGLRAFAEFLRQHS